MFDKVEAVTIPKWRLRELELKESQEIQDLKDEVERLEVEISADLFKNHNLDLVKGEQGWHVIKHEPCYPLKKSQTGGGE